MEKKVIDGLAYIDLVNSLVLLRDSLNIVVQKMYQFGISQNIYQEALEKNYNPEIFSVSNIDEAKKIILTKEGEEGSEERWIKETPALISILKNKWDLKPGITVVDYGCGIGRISKELCELGCHVVGVDISPKMRELAIEYVNNEKFSVVSPEDFVKMIESGFTCDYACAIWVLQHCLNPVIELGYIHKALKSKGELFVVNNKFSRAVPIKNNTWQNDGLNIWNLCKHFFEELFLLDFPKGVGIDERYFQCGFYKKM